ncbi:MAG TPA: DUF4173 domain-containing protein [Thermoflexia bacterium]|nr:DUF4173 domain-containing protein [Thermoflexia bacterium]
MDISKIKYPVLIAASGLLLGWLGNLLFYEQPFGISVPIFALLLLAALLGLALVERAQLVKTNFWLSGALLFLTAMSALRAAPFLRALNICGALLLLIFQAYGLRSSPLGALNLGGYIGVFFEGSFLSLALPFPLLKRSNKMLKKYGGSGKLLGRGLVGLLIATPLLIIFGILFASADPLFKEFVRDIFSPDLIGQIFLTLGLAWVAMGGLAYALTRSAEQATLLAPATGTGAGNIAELSETPTGPAADIRSVLGAVEAAVVLFSIDVLFGIFVAIQFAAHFGGEAFLQRHDLTYSEYARHGFFELLVVSVLTLGVILVLDFITSRPRPLHHRVFLAGSALLIALTLIILVSAFQRLNLYEITYGFTWLRLLPHVFMIWLAVLFALFLWMLCTRRTRLFATAALVVALGFTVTLDLLNPEVFIFRRNLERYQWGLELDVDYLGSLSEDVVPQLVQLLDSEDVEIRQDAGGWLHGNLSKLDARQEHAGWMAYHYSIERAYRLLDSRRAEIEQFDIPEYWGWYD